ncbi:transposase [Actinomyces viscosus]|nr:transposase [Actinomyces viscosus]
MNRPGFVGGSDDTEGSLSWDLRKYPDELRERATRMALDALADPARAKGAIRRIGEELGVHPEVLRTWVKKAQVDGGLRPGTTTDEAQRIKELEKEVRELRRANAILKSASACLSRRSVSAHPVDLPVHRDQEGGVRGLADLRHAQRGWCADRPEHLTHARRSRPPSARGLRDKDPQDGDIQGPQEPATRCWGPARCT